MKSHLCESGFTPCGCLIEPCLAQVVSCIHIPVHTVGDQLQSDETVRISSIAYFCGSTAYSIGDAVSPEPIMNRIQIVTLVFHTLDEIMVANQHEWAFQK